MAPAGRGRRSRGQEVPGPPPFARERRGQPDEWAPAEVDITRQLVSWRKQFVVAPGPRRVVDTYSERGRLVVTNYLQCVDTASRVLNVAPASRHYRDSFTPKYRSMLPGKSRQLQVDIVEACIQQVICMNDREFELGPAAEYLAAHMRREWAELGRLLKRLDGEQLARRPWAAGFKVELRRALWTLDEAWANFEYAYVMEAMAMEEQALALLEEACLCEEALSEKCRSRAFDGQQSPAACEWQLGELVRLLHLLSDEACADGLRYDDWRLYARALLEAKSILAAAGPQAAEDGEPAPDPARVIAARAIGAFEAVRDHLCCVRHFLGCVDGELSNNVGLVTQLAHWQEGTSAAARYLTSPRLLRALRGLAACVCAARAATPPLVAMVAARDADLFLVLPRIAWLGFLAAPDRNGPLIEHLLPELFPEPGLRGPELQHLLPELFPEPGLRVPELQAFAETYSRAVEQIADAAGEDGADTERLASVGTVGGIQLADQGALGRAFDVLVQRAVLGRGRESRPPNQVGTAVEALFQDLEGWSMRLQRRQPEVWNELSAILVQCLLGDARAESAGSGDSCFVD